MANEVAPVYVPGIGPASAKMNGEVKQVTVFKESDTSGFWSVVTLLGEVRDISASNLSFASKSALKLANGTGAAAAMEKLHQDRRDLRAAYSHLLDKRDIGRGSDSEFMEKIRAKCEANDYAPNVWTQKLGKDGDEVLFIGKLRNSPVWDIVEKAITDEGYSFKEYVPVKRETADMEEAE